MKFIEKAKQRIVNFDTKLLNIMENARPDELHEKGHVFPISLPKRFHPADETIINWGKAGSVDVPLRLYVHIPWCKSKCIFCFYESDLTEPTNEEVNTYINAIGKELDLYRTKLGRDKLETEVLYIGGGTPSILTPQQVDKFFRMLRQYVNFTENAFLITESSPGTLTRDKIDAFKQNGINRMSIGIQTLDDEILKICKRDHNVQTAKDAYQLIRDAEISEINIDLMLALPNQSYESFEQTLQETLKLSPSSISFLDLRVCPGSVLYSRFKNFYIPTWKDNIVMRAIYQEIMNGTEYERTRPHYYVKPNEMKHRSTRVPCLDTRVDSSFQIGLGVSAYSHLENMAFVNATGKEYFAKLSKSKLPITKATLLTKADKVAIMAIRAIMDTTTLPNNFYIRQQYMEQIYFLQENNLLDENLKLTNDGCLFGEEVIYSFYPRDDATRDIVEYEIGWWQARHTGNTDDLLRNLIRKFYLEYQVPFGRAKTAAELTLKATSKHDEAKSATNTTQAKELWNQAADLLYERLILLKNV